MNRDAQDKRIAAILGEIEDVDFEETIDIFFEYLKNNLSLPCEVTGIEDFRWEEIYVFGPGDQAEYDHLCVFGKREKKQNFLGGLTSLGISDISLLEHLTVVPRHPATGM